MKTIYTNSSRLTLVGASQIKTVLIGLLLIGFASCTKRESTTLTNIPSDRTDASQAQVLQPYDLAKGAVLEDRVNGVDYLILSKAQITSGRLIVKPGVTIMFEDGAGIEVSGLGSLTAIGESGNEIYFISKSGKRGDWQGLTFLNDNAANIISYCRIEHGGNSSNTFGQADLVIGNGTNAASVEVSHSTISTSSAVGILLKEGSKLRGFTGNTVSSNTTFPVSMDIANARYLQAGNTYTNNGKEFIELTGSGETVIQTPSVINQINEPYALSGVITMGNNLTIHAGTQIYMNSGAQLNIDGQNGDGSLTAVGTQSQPITLTGMYNNPGSWNAINFKTAYSALNQFEYCNISGGGQDAPLHHGIINFEGSNDVQSQVIMHHCTISNSASNGVYLQKNSIYNADIATSNSFTGCRVNVYID